MITSVVKAGDRVRIKNLAPKFNGELGTVESRDGGYVYVFLDCQPDNKEYPLEVYDNEVEKLPEDSPMEMLITPEWLREQIQNEPDIDCEAGGLTEENIEELMAQTLREEIQKEIRENGGYASWEEYCENVK